jgi:hypothetical protein
MTVAAPETRGRELDHITGDEESLLVAPDAPIRS